MVIDELIIPLQPRGELYAVHDGAEHVHGVILEGMQRHVSSNQLLATEVELPFLGGSPSFSMSKKIKKIIRIDPEISKPYLT